MLQERHEGQGLVEYGLILALVALVVAVGLAAFGEGVVDLYNRIADILSQASGG